MNIKRYIPIIIGIVALGAVLLIGGSKMDDDKKLSVDEQQESSVANKSFQGSVMRMFEGENVLEYGFDLPETATATISMDSALVKIADGGMPVLAMYTSFEGSRGYSPMDYVVKNIIPKVGAVSDMGTKVIGEDEWTVVASKNSEWHITKVANGKWLLVVENTKANSEKALALLGTLSTSVPALLAEADMMDATTSDATSSETTTIFEQ